MSFKFELNQSVVIAASIRADQSVERGDVIGRAQYLTCEAQYFVRYRAADGRAVEAWWGESALVAG